MRKRMMALALALLSHAGAVPLFSSVRLVAPQVAWGRTAGGVYRSADGGRTWLNVTPDMGGASLTDAFFLDGEQGWLAVSSGQARGPARVYRTTDGGRHWTAFRLFGRGGAGLNFTDARLGTALVGLGAATGHTAFVLLTTRDGGATWRKVNSAEYGFLPDPELKGGTLPDVSGPNAFTLLPRFGLLTGLYGPLGRPYLFITRDGGRSFTDGVNVLPYTPAERTTGAWSEVVWASGDWARVLSLSQPARGRPTARTFWTRDAGRTWHGSAAFPLPERSRASATFTDDAHGWLWVQTLDEKYQPGSLHLYRTRDGGGTWADLGQPLSGPPGDIITVSFIDPRHGLTLRWTGEGTRELWRTGDGGAHWALLP